MIQQFRIGIFVLLLAACGAFAKVPLITLAATCTRASQVITGTVAHIKKDAHAIDHDRWIAKIRVLRTLKGQVKEFEYVYFQPQSSVSAHFKDGETYVVFAYPFEQGVATVNGEGGVFHVEDNSVTDYTLFDSLGKATLGEFETRVMKECKSGTPG
jgi:hypothetical protein